jgi:hypothetical protein
MGTVVNLFDGLGNPIKNIITTDIPDDTLLLTENVEADVTDIWLFMVLDDDPLQPYNPFTREGGRKVILYRYDETEANYVPVRPYSIINKNELIFNYSLPTSADYPSLVQYTAIMDRVITVKASTVNTLTGLLIESNPIKFYLNIPESQKGIYTLPTSESREGATLDSAVYLTIDRFGGVQFLFDMVFVPTTTTSTTTTTTTTSSCPVEYVFQDDHFDDNSLAGFWTVDVTAPDGAVTEPAGTKVVLDSGAGNFNVANLLTDMSGCYQGPICGDFDVTFLLTDQTEAGAFRSHGIVAKIANDIYVAINIQGPTGVKAFINKGGPGTSSDTMSIAGLPIYLRIQRVSGLFKMYHSANGTDWTMFEFLGWQELTSNRDVEIWMNAQYYTGSASTHEIKFDRAYNT